MRSSPLSTATRNICAARSPAQVNLKFAPEIRFRVDEVFANAAKIDAMLQTAKVAQDLSAPDARRS